MFQSLLTTWGAFCNTGNVAVTFKVLFLSDQADGIETLCSVLIKNPEDQQVQVPSSKSLGDSPGVNCEKEKMDLQKKRPEVFQKNTFTLMKAGYGLMM